MAMTMTKLARLANVSVSTVSKAFSGSSEISDEKKEIIFNIAKETGCYDKFCKNTYNKSVIAVICPEFQSRYYSEQLTFLEREINKHNGTMIASSTDFDAKREEELVAFFSEHIKVDGIVLYEPQTRRKCSFPIVAIGFSETYDSIYLSHRKALVEAVKHFAEYGHSNIAYLGDEHTSHIRILFEEAMEKCKMTINKEYLIENKDRFEMAGYEGMKKLLSFSNPPTAVLAAYDYIAIGAMKYIDEQGFKIPEDISIIGTDDIGETSYLNVPLTSITTYNEDLSQIAVDAIFERIRRKDNVPLKSIKVSTELVKRGSVGRVKTET